MWQARKRAYYLVYAIGLPLYTFAGALLFWHLEGDNDRKLIWAAQHYCDKQENETQQTIMHAAAVINSNNT